MYGTGISCSTMLASCVINTQANLAGYLFDEHERDSAHLRVQFARNPPSTRVGGGHRGNH